MSDVRAPMLVDEKYLLYTEEPSSLGEPANDTSDPVGIWSWSYESKLDVDTWKPVEECKYVSGCCWSECSEETMACYARGSLVPESGEMPRTRTTSAEADLMWLLLGSSEKESIVVG